MKLVRFLGRGAFGDVSLYLDEEIENQFAVKTIKLLETNFWQTDTQQQSDVQQLQNEIKHYRFFSHENIVKYYGSDTDESDYTMSIYLEYMPGGSLHDCLHTKKGDVPFSLSKTKHYALQILNGVRYLHCWKVVHRDIKPANILRDKNDNIKLTDFGLAKQLDSLSQGASTKEVGTYRYMAPEVVKDDVKYGVQADIWSFGCTIFEMLTALPPWNNKKNSQIIQQLNDGILFEFELPSSCSNVKKLISRCCEQDPKRRPTADELFDKLKKSEYSTCKKIMKEVNHYFLFMSSLFYNYMLVKSFTI